MDKELRDLIENGRLTDGERAIAHAALAKKKGDKHHKAATDLLASGILSDGDRVRVLVACDRVAAAPKKAKAAAKEDGGEASEA